MKKALLGAIIVIGLLALGSTPVYSLGYTPGCKVGDWVYMVGTGNYTSLLSGDFYDTHPDWTKSEVVNVSGTLVTLKHTNHYKNGTIKESIIVYDIENGELNGTSAIFAFQMAVIAKDLSEGDPLWSGSIDTVNRTETMNINGTDREVVVNVWTLTVLNVTMGITTKWDRATGLMVYLYTFTNSSYGYQYSEYKAIDASFVHESSSGAGLNIGGNTLIYGGVAVIVVVAIVGALFFLRRRG